MQSGGVLLRQRASVALTQCLAVLHLLVFMLSLRQTQGLRASRDVEALDAFSSEFVRYAESRAALIGGRRTVVLTFASQKYESLMANFLVNMRRLHVSNYVMVCLDKEALSFANLIREPCFDAAIDFSEFKYTKPRQRVWAIRMFLLPRLLRAGIGALMTDMDAFWLKDPQKIVVGGDITSSVDFKWPEFTQEQIGASACMGFIYFNASPAVVKFLVGEVSSYFQGDDQVALNHALVEGNLSFPGGKFTLHRSSPATPAAAFASGRAWGLEVRFLDHGRFQRQCDLESPYSAEQAYVRHCVRHEGVLPLLRKDWNRVTQGKPWDSFEDWMHAVRNVLVH